MRRASARRRICRARLQCLAPFGCPLSKARFALAKASGKLKVRFYPVELALKISSMSRHAKIILLDKNSGAGLLRNIERLHALRDSIASSAVELAASAAPLSAGCALPEQHKATARRRSSKQDAKQCRAAAAGAAAATVIAGTATARGETGAESDGRSRRRGPGPRRRRPKGDERRPGSRSPSMY